MAATAYQDFLTRYQAAYQQQLSEHPRFYFQGEGSPCLTQAAAELDAETAVFWQHQPRKQAGQFHNVAQALAIELHPSIEQFYGQYWCAPTLWSMSVVVGSSEHLLTGELIGVWNEADFQLLQQNIIGHLMMKQQLKQPLTWFIGLVDDTEEMLTVNNQDGSVWLEKAGAEPHFKLAGSLAEFLTQLQPRVAPPVAPMVEEDTELAHEGMWARLKRMLMTFKR